MSQAQHEVENGAAVSPPEMRRFIFQTSDEAQAGIASTVEVVSTPATTEPSQYTAPCSYPVPEVSAPVQEASAPVPDEAANFPHFQFGQNGTEARAEQPFDLTADEPVPQTSARRQHGSERLLSPGIAYFQQMMAQFQTFPVADGNSPIGLVDNPYAISAIQTLAARREHTLTWEDLDRMEIALLRVLPETQLRSQAWSVRGRYFESAGPALSALYLASRPAGWNDSSIDADLLRADLEALVSETQRNRVLPPEIDYTLEFLSDAAGKWAIGLCVVGMVGFIAARIVLAPSDADPIFPLAAALLSGAVGGFLSLQSRLSRAIRLTLPQQEQVQALLDTPPLFLYPVQGAVFAAFFYFLVLGGVLRGTVFPSARIASLITPAGGAQLIAWCFVIGLLARFLPNIPRWVRSRFVRRPVKTSS